MNVFIRILAILTIVFACLGALLFVVTALAAKGAPQEAAGSAMALALTIIPYCFLRGFEIFARNGKGSEDRP